MADRTPLAVAAARKRDAALSRASRALRELEGAGEAVSFQGVARRAGVSRQWLYQQPDVRAEIERLREHGPTGATTRGLDRDRATEASLRQRVQTLADENRCLREEISALRAELAISYGHQREATPHAPASSQQAAKEHAPSA